MVRGGSRGDRGDISPHQTFWYISVDVFILISLFGTIIPNSKYNFDLSHINNLLLLINFLLSCCEICTMYVCAVPILDDLWFNRIRSKSYERNKHQK